MPKIKPAWQRRLENTLNNIRTEITGLTEFRKMEYPSKRFRIIVTNPNHPDHPQHLDVYTSKDHLKHKWTTKAKRLCRYNNCSASKQRKQIFYLN